MLAVSTWRRTVLFLVAAACLFSVVPSGEAFAGTFGYISNPGNNTVSVVDVATRTIVATIPVGARPEAIAAKKTNPTGVYVANSGGNSVSVIDPSTNTVTTTIAVGGGPSGIAVNSTGTRVYVTNFSSNTVSVINTATNTVLSTVNVGQRPVGIAVHPDDVHVYVAVQLDPNAGPGKVQVIDTGNGNAISDIAGTFGIGPNGIVVTPDGLKAYVTNLFSNSVSVINTATASVSTTLSMPGSGRLEGITINPSGARVAVSNIDANTVTVIFTGTDTIDNATPVTVGTFPAHLAWAPAGFEIWVSNGFSNSVSVLETETYSTIATLSANSPRGLAFITTTPSIDCCWNISPSSILEWQTIDVTITGKFFEPGITANFGSGIEVQSVDFVSPTQIKARIFAIPGGMTVPATQNQQQNPVSVQNRDGGAFSTANFDATPFTLVRDTDGDGVGDSQDNCKLDFNPNQAPEACQTPTALNGTGSISTTTPALGEPTFTEYCVTFPGGQGPYFFAPPDDRTVHLNATDANGQTLDRRVPESVVMVIPDGLLFNDGTADIVRCYVTDVSQQISAPAGATVTLEAKYHNIAQPIGFQLLAPGTNTPAPLLVAEVDFPAKVYDVQSGPAVQTVGGSLAVNPTFWSLVWESTPTTGTAVFTFSALTGGAVVSQIDLASLRFEGTLAPATTALIGDTLRITVNKTDLMRALRKRVVQAFTTGQTERIQLTGKLANSNILSVGVDIVLGSPTGLIDDLIADIQASSIRNPNPNSFINKLEDAKEAFLSGNMSRACSKMNDFIQHTRAQRGKGVPTAVADDWITRATGIRTGLLQC